MLKPEHELWEDSQKTLLEKNFKQIVTICGDGHLKDDTDCSRELRNILARVEAEKLFEYVNYCIEQPFEKSGQALQDVINELGRRLGYEVENGLYGGRVNKSGQDGIWLDRDIGSIILEAKTSDTYMISLDKLIEYRNKSVASGKVEAGASILIVVGRENTGGLEAQIRGSRHAWDIRIISVKALCDLVKLNMKSDEVETSEKIRTLFKPIEYTRIDALIDVVFTAVEDVDSDDTSSIEDGETSIDSEETGGARKQEHTPRMIQDRLRSRAANSLAKKLKKDFIAQRRTEFLSIDKSVLAVALVSKVYVGGNLQSLWFGLHPKQVKNLSHYDQGFLLLASVQNDLLFALDIKMLQPLIPRMNKTEGEKRVHWHIDIRIRDDGYFLTLKNGETIDISNNRVPLVD